MKNAPKKQNSDSMLAIREETVDQVLKKIQIFQNDGELALPENYSAPNALKSAWLTLLETVDKNKNPVLAVCTRASIANCMLNMAIQGLNPAKKQCYFVAYGKTLTMMPSYQGNKAVALRVDADLKDIIAEVVYAKDDFIYEIKMGLRIIVDHRQKIENINPQEIVAAYALAITHEDIIKRTELMSFDEIKQSWAQSKMSPITDKGHLKTGTTHAKFTAEMCKRTVINRLCKNIIGGSDDRNLVKKAAQMVEDETAKAIAQAETDQYANKGDVIDVNHHNVDEPKEEPKEEPKKKEPQKKEPQKKEPQKEAPQDDEPENYEDLIDDQAELTDDEKEKIRLAEIAEAEAERKTTGKPPF